MTGTKTIRNAEEKTVPVTIEIAVAVTQRKDGSTKREKVRWTGLVLPE